MFSGGGGYWDYALNIDINTIVYLHCHQSSSLLIPSKPDDLPTAANITTNSSDNNSNVVAVGTGGGGVGRRKSSTCTSGGASIVLVGQDGIQHPPIRFPKGSHLLQFLTCLEAGLGPDGSLDPPLRTEVGKGKVFPRLQRRSIKNRISENPLPTVFSTETDDTAFDSTTTASSTANTNTSNQNVTNTPTNTSPTTTTIGEIVDQEEQEGDFVFRIINSKSNGISFCFVI